MTNHYRAFSLLLGDRAFAYHPILARVAGSAKAGILLSLLCHYGLTDTAMSEKRGGWFYQTVESVTAETGLTADEQRTARTELTRLGLIESKRKGVPPIWHYRVVYEKIAEMIDQPEAVPAQPEPEDEVVEVDDFPVEVYEDIHIKPTRTRTVKATFEYGKNQSSNMAKTDISLTVNPSVNPNNGGDQIPDIPTFKKIDRDINHRLYKFPSDISGLADEFIVGFGREPVDKSEYAFWIKELRKCLKMGLAPGDIAEAMAYMRLKNLTVKSPGSICAIAYSLTSNRNVKKPLTERATEVY